MALITVKELSAGYENKPVLENINFTVDEGDYLCVVGENGSGKTTLMKTLLGLIPVLKGEIIFADGLKKGEIGYLPQQTAVQKDFPASVREIVISGCQGRGKAKFFYSKDDKKLADEKMKQMDIFDYASKCFRDLSGGQQQRVLLARALCAARKILLLDEPVSGLDPVVTAEMYELINDLNNEGIAVIMISHDITQALSYADHILHIGDTVFFGTPDEYPSSDIGKAFLKNSAAGPQMINTGGILSENIQKGGMQL